MTDDVKQILAQWERPEPPADLAERIIARAGVSARAQRRFPRLALAASLVLAVALGATLYKPQPVPQEASYTVNGIPLLADVDLSEGEDEFAFLDEGMEWEL